MVMGIGIKLENIVHKATRPFVIAGASAYLFLNLIGCNGNAVPTPNPSPTPKPPLTQTYKPEPAHTFGPYTPTPANTPTATNTPLPINSNPATAYASNNGLSHLVQRLEVLGQDGILDENEKGFIDHLRFISSSLIPEGVRQYYTNEDVASLQKKLVDSVLNDKQVSNLEATALQYLRGFSRFNIQRDIIYSGMIDDKFLLEDWDGDKSQTGEPLTNITELKQGTNPLNELETVPTNPSERYAVIAAFSNVFPSPKDPSILIPTDLIAHDALEFYHLLRKNGYDDDHITLFLYRIDQDLKEIGPGLPIPKPISETVAPLRTRILPDDDPLWKGDDEWAGKNLLSDLGSVKIDYDTNDVTTLNFLNAVSSLPTDDNDDIFMYYASHGVGTSTPGEGAIAFTAGPGKLDSYWQGFKLYDIFMRHYLLNKAIQNIRAYGRLVIMQDGCNTGAVLKDLDKTDANQDYRDGVQPSPIRDTLALSATLPDESQSGVGFGHYFLNLLRKDPYLPVSRVVGEADLIEDKSLDATVEHSIMYPFGIRGSWPNWISIVGYSKMEKP